MKTLTELIAEGLPVGALVRCVETNILFQIMPNGYIQGIMDLYKREVGRVFMPILKITDSIFTIGNYEPTTAYDSDIDPETLPIPEPFWTGWVVVDRMKDWVRFPVLRYHYSGDLMTEIECSDMLNSKLSPTDCQPCLPPA